MIIKIISGGQTGVDTAALDVAILLDIEHGGFCPKGRRCETGTIPVKFNLQPLDSFAYSDRTRQNISSSDGTLILTPRKKLDGGTLLTYLYALKIDKPCLVLKSFETIEFEVFNNWILKYGIECLNIAGPRESKNPGLYFKAYNYLSKLLR